MSKLNKDFAKVSAVAFSQADLPTALAFLSEAFLANVWRADSFWLQADKETLFFFVGVKDWSKASVAKKKQAGDKLAVAFKEYLFTGKAESVKLEQVLQVFVEWSKLCYRKLLAGDNVKGMNAQVGELFNRLLVAEEYVSKNELLAGYYGKLPQTVQKKLTAKEVQGLESLATKADIKAQKDLWPAINGVFKPSVQEKIATSYAGVHEYILASLKKQPLYKAIAELAKAGTVDVWQLATDYLNKEQDGSYKGEFTEDELKAVDYLAEVYDFASGAMLAQAIVATLPVDLQAQVATTRKLSAMYDSVYSNPPALEQKSQEVMYNEYGARLTAGELRLIAKEGKKAVKADDLYKEQQAKALNDIAKLPIAKAIDVKMYVAAERMAWEKAQVAWADGKLAEAFKQKEIQLYNHFLVQESLAVSAHYEDLHKFLLQESLKQEDAWADEKNFAQVAALLQRFGYMGLGDAVEFQESLFEYVRRQEKENPDIVKVASWLEGDTALYQPEQVLTLDEFVDVANAVRNINKIDSIGLLSDGLVVVGRSKSELVDRLKSTQGKVGADVSAAVRFEGKNIDELLMPLGEVWRQTFLLSVQKATKSKLRLWQKVCTRLEKAFAEAGLAKEQRYKDSVEKVFVAEWQAFLSKFELWVMALNLGSEENVRCLLKELPERFGVGDLTEDEVKYILSKYLTQKDFALVGKIWRALDLSTEYGAMSKVVCGFCEKKKELPFIDFVLSDGSYVSVQGGSYFLRQDEFLALAKERKLQNYLGMVPYDNVLTGATSVDSWSIEWDFACMFEHVERLVHDICLRPVLHDLNKLLADEAVQASLLKRANREGLLTLASWQKSVARDDKMVEWAIWAEVVSELLESKPLTNDSLFMQVADLPKDVDIDIFNWALADYIPAVLNDVARAGELADFVADKSTLMKEKMKKLSFLDKESFVVSDGKIALKKGQGEQFLQWARLLTAVPIWLAAYEKCDKQEQLADEAVAQVVSVDGLPAMEDCLAMFMAVFNEQVAVWQADNAVVLSDDELARLALVMAKQYVGMGVVRILARLVCLPKDFAARLASWSEDFLPSREYMAKVGLKAGLGFGGGVPVIASVRVSSLLVEDKDKLNRWFFSAYNGLR